MRMKWILVIFPNMDLQKLWNPLLSLEHSAKHVQSGYLRSLFALLMAAHADSAKFGSGYQVTGTSSIVRVLYGWRMLRVSDDRWAVLQRRLGDCGGRSN